MSLQRWNGAPWWAAVLGTVILVHPLVAQAQGQVQIDDPLGGQTFSDILNNVGGFLATIALPLATIFIVVAGIMFLTARGNEQKVSQAKKMLTYAVIGFFIVLLGAGIISVVADIIGVTSPSGSPSG